MKRKVKSKKDKIKKFQQTLSICLFIFLFSTIIFSQKIAILTPEKTEQTESFAKKLETSLSEKFKVADLSLAENVLRINNFENPFNLTNTDAKNLGVGIGCNFFILIKSETLRRSSFEKNEYYESYATFFLVSSRTGRLVFFKLFKFEENDANHARSKLFSAIDEYADEIAKQIKIANDKELNEENLKIEELPDADSVEGEGFRPPLPYKRIKPIYTKLASFYDVVATVDVLVDIDENGKILQTEIVRWAGFGLDESVVETVNEMNWRPADRKGKTLAMRVLLRYNFRNIETK